MSRFLDDILFIIGLLIIISTTFILNIFIGCYLLGIILIVAAIFTSKKPDNKN